MTSDTAPEWIWVDDERSIGGVTTILEKEPPYTDDPYTTCYVRANLQDARIAELEEALDQIQGMGFDMPMTLDLSELAWSKRRAGTMQHIARTALQKKDI